MLKNYFRIALRNLFKHRGYALINIVGLSVGFICSVLIYLWVVHEFSYDAFHEKADRIAKVHMTWVFGESTIPTVMATTFPGPGLTEEFSYVTDFVRIKQGGIGDMTVRGGDRTYKESQFFYADSSFFKLFSFELQSGNPDEALKSPGSVVLTRSTARRYFGGADPMGKTVTLLGGNERLFTVTGIAADPPENSHFDFDFLASFTSLPEADRRAFNSSSYHTYLLMDRQGLFGQLQQDIDAYLEDYFGGTENTPMLSVMPLRDIHLRTEFPGEFKAGGDIRYVYVFSAIGLLILLISGINYMNLATARAMDRAREVGMRKVLGARRSQLWMQFLGEALIFSLIALTLSLMVCQMLMLMFNELTGRELDFGLIMSADVFGGLLLITLLVALAAGAYPAFYLSGFQPGRVLKGSFKTSASGIRLRKSLIVVQFAITIFLITGTLVIGNQMDHIRSQNLGYDQERVMVLPVPESLRDRANLLKEQLADEAGVSGVSLVSAVPMGGAGARTFNPGTEEETRSILNVVEIDENYVGTLGLELVAGANVFPVQGSYSNMKLLLNEQAATHFGWSPEEAVGQVLNSRAYGEGGRGEVVGVVRDFNYRSLHRQIEPLVLVYIGGSYSYLALDLMVKLRPGDMQESIASVNGTWDRVTQEMPFEYSFLDSQFDRIYQAEQKAGILFRLFSVVAVVIACMGLIGMASIVTRQRSREIGIRKILGATYTHIVGLVTVDFVKLVGISFLVAGPVSYGLMNRWLADFAYRVEVGWSTPVLAGFCALALALLALAYQSAKLALMDPLESLKAE